MRYCIAGHLEGRFWDAADHMSFGVLWAERLLRPGSGWADFLPLGVQDTLLIKIRSS
jgi:hypothetical protein